MEKLVSVIMPCFNSEKWIKEAIDSCLNQTYPNIEIIIIDDGSTDNSLKSITSYGKRVVWESQSNSGSNIARNRGFSISKGEYILYLDSDDYILPERIEKQVCCLETTQADVVFSSVRSQKHLPDGTISFGNSSDERFYVPGDDILFSLLSGRRLAHTLSPMFTRATVAKSGGWDPRIKCSQDRDFLLSAALNGARFVFLPGCYSVYRQYESNIRVSTSSKKKIRIDSELLRTEKAERRLIEKGCYQKYSVALAEAYFRILFHSSKDFSYSKYLKVLNKIKTIEPAYKPDFSALNIRSPIYKALNNVFRFWMASFMYKLLKDSISFSRAVSRMIL